MNNELGYPPSHRWKRTVLGFVLALILIGTGFGSGIAAMWLVGPQVRQVVASNQPEILPDPIENDVAVEERLGLLEEIWTILNAEFIDPEALDAEEMVHSAAAGFVAALDDPHTAFVEPVQAAIIQEDMQGSFEGIGATVEMIDGVLTIVRPLPNSPAAKAGIQAGDEILEVNGESLEGLNITEAISLIRGPRGTVVRLLVRREGIDEPFVVPVTRDRVELEILQTRMLDENVAYLSLAEFNAVSANQVRQGLAELLAEAPVGLVLDLRNNPGGYLQMAVEIAGEFLPRGTLIVSEEQREGPVTELRARRNGTATEIPVVVLVNGGSASASEIVAGAIQDHERGILIGESTFGKGSVQHTHTLSDGSSLRVTIAKWILPAGRVLNGDGIEPDIVVSIMPEEVEEGTDPQLSRAVEYLLETYQ